MFFKKKETEERAVTKYTAPGLIPDLFRLNFFSQRRVNQENVSVAYRCIQLISATVADTPIYHFITEEKDGLSIKQKQKSTKVALLLKNPNPYQTQFDFISEITQDLTSTGNAFIWDDTESGNLWVIPSRGVQVYVTTDYQNPFYYQIDYYGKNYKMYPDEIIHIRNPLTGADNSQYVGLNPVEQHRLLFNAYDSMTEFNKVFFDNANQITGVLETENRLSEQAVETLRKSFSKRFSGSKNAGKVPVLSDGLKYKQLKPISPQDADYLQSKKMTAIEICSLYGVPPSLLGIDDAKYSNYEQQAIQFRNNTIGPILTAIEQSLSKWLIPSYRPKESIEFLPNKLKQSTVKEQAELLSLLRNSSIITSNEARHWFDLPALDNEVATELKDNLDQTSDFVGDNVAQPKNTNDTSSDTSQDGITRPDQVSTNTAYNQNRSEDIYSEIRKEIHRLKTDNGRLRKELETLKDK